MDFHSQLGFLWQTYHQSKHFYYLCSAIKFIEIMVQLAAIWIISVVVFFALWALLAYIIKKVSQRKDDPASPDDLDNLENNQQNIQQ